MPVNTTHLNDVEVVLITERVQNGGHCALSNGEPLPGHAAACVQQYDDVLWCAGCLDVPGTNTDWHDVPPDALEPIHILWALDIATCINCL